MRQYIGTEDLAGATVVSVGYNDMTLEKDGRTLYLELEYEANYNSMCEGCCGCGYTPAYFRAEEETK